MKRGMRLFALVIGALAYSSMAGAQSTPLERMRNGVAAEIRETGDRRLDMANDLDYLAMLGRRNSMLVRILQQHEKERADKQLGATSSASGTTTLVSKGTVPKILSFAVENGALTQSQSNTTLTFRGNLGGVVRALAGQGLFQLDDDPSFWVMSRASFSVSFDASRGGGNAANTFTGDKQQVSQWTFRYQLVNRRDPQGSTARQAWDGRVGDALASVAGASRALAIALEVDSEFQEWLDGTATAVQAAKASAIAAKKKDPETESDIARVMAEREAAFPAPAQLKQETLEALDEWDQSTSAFVGQRQALLNRLRSAPLVSLEYTNDRPLRAPKTSNVRLVGEVGGTIDITGNAAITLFDGDIPLGAERRVRDFQAAGELAFKMGSANSVGAFVLSLSGKFIRQFENSYDEAGIMLPDTKGTTAIGQFKLTIPAQGTGVRIPLSISVANRTDLIKERIVRANVGVSYDLDPLFARLRP